MARARAHTPESAPASKRLKTSHPAAATAPAAVHDAFQPGLLAPGNSKRLRAEYTQSTPFKHAIIDALFDGDLLVQVRVFPAHIPCPVVHSRRQAKDECIRELSFTEKETDIYKVRRPQSDRACA
jgi:hypothetical protein